MHGDAWGSKARCDDGDELYAWCDEKKGEDERGVSEPVGEEVKVND